MCSVQQRAHPISLYIHIPFCSKKCPYCAFYKEIWKQPLEDEFVTALLKEIETYKNENLTIHTIFFGGGTPTQLNPTSLEKIMAKLTTTFTFTPNIEITSEANPESLDNNRLTLLKNLGFNRISVGIQSFREEDLKFLGRWHTQDHIHTALSALKDQQWNFNIDLIFGLPNAKIIDSLSPVLSYNPTHISTYALSIEENTPFEKKGIQNIDDETENQEYQTIITTLTDAGYKHYEVSAFAKPGSECAHNLAYWTFSPYIGLGPSASSFYKNQRFTNPSDLSTYIKNPTPAPPTPLTKNELMQEYLIANLRRLDGFRTKDFETHFQTSFTTTFEKEIETLTHKNLLTITDNIVRITPKGLPILNEVLLHFI